jgi:hemerythrin
MAEAFQWSDSLMSGIGMIDTQHRHLIKRINQFVAACDEAAVPATIGLLLRFLYIYADDHFASEEELMRSTLYPGEAQHLAQHAYFRQELESLKNALGDTGPTPQIAERARKLLVDWFMHHIANTDQELAAYLLEKQHPSAGIA